MKPFADSRWFTALRRPLWFGCGSTLETSGLVDSGSTEGRELTFKMRALFNREAFVKEVAFDVGLGLQHHP